MTHYIPAYTRINGRRQETACLTWILPAQHSNEPQCSTCQTWLEQDAAMAVEEMETFGYELRDGFLAPKEVR